MNYLNHSSKSLCTFTLSPIQFSRMTPRFHRHIVPKNTKPSHWLPGKLSSLSSALEQKSA